VDRRDRARFTARLARDVANDRELAELALRSALHSAFDRVSAFARGRRFDTARLLGHSRGKYFATALVRHRACDRRLDADRQTSRAIGRKAMNWIVFVLIPVALIAFVTGQLFLKRAMESSREKGFRDARVISFLVSGILSMSVNFFLTLGLLAHLDLSFVYPFQGLSVIIISLAAAIVLRERLNFRLTLGALLISAGIVLVSMS
jgi:uncharacterized membrane protein